MANEIQLAYGVTGRTLYAVIRSSTGTVWNGAAFVAFVGANWTAYAVAMADQGGGYYVGNFPVVAAGTYNVEVRDQSGGGPLITDPLAGSGSISWDGTQVTVDPTATQSAAAVAGATVTELGAVPAASPTLVQALALLYMTLRNQITVDATSKKVHTDTGAALATKTLADDGVTYSEAKMA